VILYRLHPASAYLQVLINYSLPTAGSDVWDGSLVGNMEGVSLSPTAGAREPLLQSMRSEVEAAWEEHAAKKSKLNSPEATLGAPEKVDTMFWAQQ